jgi:hypothetical protein
MGGDIYSFSLSAGVSLNTLGSISLTSDQVNSNRYTKGKEQVLIGDALWCCFQAVTTIGYGDITVTSAIGRAIVVALSVKCAGCAARRSSARGCAASSLPTHTVVWVTPFSCWDSYQKVRFTQS